MKVLIYLLGPAGSGKYTISKKICELRPSLKLVHNHHINNVIFEIVNPDGRTKLPRYVWENVALVRNAVLSTVRATDRNEGYIFTNVLSENCPSDLAVYEEVRALAKEKHLAFCPVRISIDLDELCNRIVSPERVAMLKDISRDNARSYHETQIVLRPNDEHLELDVTTLTPEESATSIVEWARRRACAYQPGPHVANAPCVCQGVCGPGNNVRLEEASRIAPLGLRELLVDLGGGENGFMGTPVHTGEATVEEYLQRCRDMPDPAKLKPGLVPQTVFWMLDADGFAVGMVRIRHFLNDKLRIHGGHIGFFVRRDRRGKGFAKEGLRLALVELHRLGEERALLTVDPDNIPSISVIESNGGRFEGIGTDPDTGKRFRRYWIDMEPQQGVGR